MLPTQKKLLYRQGGVRLIYTTMVDEPDIEEILTDQLASLALGLDPLEG
ncbi:MAG: hypothetical protein HY298_20950 [Verrucomicrobia bacterium]|nr:hypothetical protein [Verrucomicrobiota bacterium]